MTKKDWMHLSAIPQDMERRKRRIDMLERRQADGPICVSDTVLSSTDAGDASINCHATVHGQDARFAQVEQTIRAETEALREMDARYWSEYAEACSEIEAEPDPQMRVMLHDVLLYGKRYTDVERETESETGAEAVRMRVYRWVDKHATK